MAFRYDCLAALDFARLLTVLSQEHIIVVKDSYPGDCLQYRRIVDHTQSIYVVPGQEKKPATPEEPPVESAPASLQIKARAADVVHETPRR